MLRSLARFSGPEASKKSTRLKSEVESFLLTVRAA
jgi:hypothetical protein